MTIHEPSVVSLAHHIGFRPRQLGVSSLPLVLITDLDPVLRDSLRSVGAGAELGTRVWGWRLGKTWQIPGSNGDPPGKLA